MLQSLRARLRREAFLTTPLSIVINPVYIIRRGLFKSISRIAPNMQGDVLDFGCGSKPYESLFRNAASYVGVDVKISGHNHKSSKIDFFYDGRTLPFADGSFDAVVCFEVFEHIFNIDEVLVEIGRVLKQDGQLLLTIPFAWDEHEAPFDFARYTSFGITHILRKNGFRVIELEKTTTYFLAISQMFIAFLYQHVLPRGRVLGRLFQLAAIFPLTVFFLAMNLLFPRRDQYFCNSVVLARKLHNDLP